MNTAKTINSISYWDSRFSESWEEFQGPKQSRFFARIAIEHLPPWLMDQMRRQGLTLADWGCAQGDGTDVWTSFVPAEQIVGVDFSSVAIEQASQRYPALRFISADWLADSKVQGKTFDVIFSSNTLEHFHKPYDVLKIISDRARKAVVLALPYQELDRIPEHFFSFIPENIPLKIADGFRLIWSKIVDCRFMQDTLWSGYQIILVYADSEWTSELALTLSDCHLEKVDAATQIDFLEKEGVQLRSQIELLQREKEQLSHQLASREQQIAGLSQVIRQGQQEVLTSRGEVARLRLQVEAADADKALVDQQLLQLSATVDEKHQTLEQVRQQVLNMEHELSEVRQSVNAARQTIEVRDAKIGEFLHSTSWRVTRPLRAAKRVQRALSDPAARYALLKSIFWRLPESWRHGLHSQRARYVAAHWDAGRKAEHVAGSLAIEPRELPEWVATARPFDKVAVIPCAFEFDELVNQRPINAAKYFAKRGYFVLFIAWQWGRKDELSKGCNLVWPGIYQVPLFEFVDMHGLLPTKEAEALYLLTMPARVLLGCVLGLRGKGYAIAYDVMDEWQEFFKSGQAPWYEQQVEEQLVLQSDVVCCVAPALVEKFSGIRNDILLIGNGYSEDVIGRDHNGISLTSWVAQPVVGYFGHLTDAWFDWRLVFDLAAKHSDVRFEIIGYGEPQWVRDHARSIGNLVLVGKVHPSELHTYVRHWSGGIIPFVEGPLSRAVDPIKIYEYIYFGLPAFVTGIQHLQTYPGVVWAARDRVQIEFASFLARKPADAGQVASFLAATTWDARFDSLMRLLRQHKNMGDLYDL